MGMATYTQILYHIVFSTKERRPVLLPRENREKLFGYVWGILKKKECHVYRLNGVEDHLHMLTSLPPRISLSELMHDLKLATSKWIREEKVFPDFTKWQEGYGAFTLSWPERNDVIEYIKGQEKHHRKISFREEYMQMLQRFGVKFEEKYLE
jgi:putative transposase